MPPQSLDLPQLSSADTPEAERDPAEEASGEDRLQANAHRRLRRFLRKRRSLQGRGAPCPSPAGEPVSPRGQPTGTSLASGWPGEQHEPGSGPPRGAPIDEAAGSEARPTRTEAPGGSPRSSRARGRPDGATPAPPSSLGGRRPDVATPALRSRWAHDAPDGEGRSRTSSPVEAHEGPGAAPDRVRDSLDPSLVIGRPTKSDARCGPELPSEDLNRIQGILVDEHRCRALTESGQRCLRASLDGRGFCRVHGFGLRG